MKRHLAVCTAAAALAVPVGGCRAAGEKTGAGLRWQAITLPFDTAVRDLFFLDADNGWAVGGGRTVKGGLIASTRDGGTTWSVQTNIVTGLLNPTWFSFAAVRFVNAERGWVGGGDVILRTLDGGKTWDHQLEGRSARGVGDLFFLDQDRGWAATSDGILRTIDGGASWTAGHGDYRLTASAVQFLDENTGFAASRSGIFKSKDGGRSWEETGLPDLEFSGLHFLTPQLGWVVGANGVIVHTRDGGASWQTQKTDLRPGVFPLLVDVKFADERRGYVVGFVPAPGWDDSMIFHTEDGGETWRLQQEPEGQRLHVLDLVDAEHAWTAGERNAGRVRLMRLRP